jgi:hypothetical protein
MGGFLYSLVVLLVVLGILVFIHELGHYWAAKAFGVWVHRFAVGMGPPVKRLSFRRGETEWAIAWPRTGQPILEKQRLPDLRNVYASPVAAKGRIYFTDRDGTTLVLADAPEVKVLATNKLDTPVDASLALVGDEIILRSKTHLYAIGE